MELIDSVIKAKPWTDVYANRLKDLLGHEALASALNEVLKSSDEMLLAIGATDFTNEAAIKSALRAQGIAQGLVQAVEVICNLATSSVDSTIAEEKENV